MGVEQERFGEEFVPPWVMHEHHARYRHAAAYLSGLTVLDCACGTGLGSAAFLGAGPRRLLAVDLSAEAVAQARRRAPAATVLRGSATAVPLAARSVDAVVSLETIEHLPDDAAYLEEIARVLRPGGLFICSTPNRTVTNPGATLVDRPFNRFHEREYSQEEFRALLEPRFEGVELFGQNACSPLRVEIAGRLGRWIGPRFAARALQALKLPRLLHDRAERYAVQSQRPGVPYEYVLAVCRRRAAEG